MSALLEVQDLRVWFENRQRQTRAVDAVSFSIDAARRSRSWANPGAVNR